MIRVHSSSFYIDSSKEKQMGRNERQRQLNQTFSVLPTFSPLANCHIYHLNQTTSLHSLPHLIELARETTRFTIDTEHDYWTHEPALIQMTNVTICS